MPIRAKITTDDDQYSTDFNAQRWFNKASDAELVGLAGVGWGGDYEADAVAHHSTDPEVKRILDYCQTESVGFEVHINEQDAIDWIRLSKPLVHDAIRAAAK